MTSEHLQPWAVRTGDYPCSGTTEQKLRFALSFAVLAPSANNSQPWRFHVHGSTVDLYADRSRLLPVGDPAGRQLTISCGAALCNLLVALRHYGWGTWVEILPDAEHSDLLARVSLWMPSPGSRSEHRLIGCITGRHTYRAPFSPRPVSGEVLAALSLAAREEGARLVVVPDEHREAVARLVFEGELDLAGDPRFREEQEDWIHVGPAPGPDGIPWCVWNPDDSGAASGHPEQRAARARDLCLAAPALCLVVTAGDRLRDWLQAGRALERVLLEGVSLGAQASYLNQPILVKSLRQQLTRTLALSGEPQMLLRLGYPVHHDEGGATPRRQVPEVVD